MQERVTVSGERGVIGRSLDWITTRFGRKPSDLVFRGRMRLPYTPLLETPQRFDLRIASGVQVRQQPSQRRVLDEAHLLLPSLA